MTGLTQQAAQNIEHYRTQRGITRTELARRCTAAGLPTRRPALAGLLGGARQTITLQELIVLAQALEVTVAELVLPLHTGAPVLVDDGEPIHPYTAAQRLFGIPPTGRLDRSPTYRLTARYLAAVDRFTAANARLLALSHALASGTATPSVADGRPHPAVEILATEAALSRLVDALAALHDAGITPPSVDAQAAVPDLEAVPSRLPLLYAASRPDYPLFVYQLQPGSFPTAELITRPQEP